ncbi:hypothetical protein NHX12_027555 [Muraenolepis orangiensis]|uniref:Uncharacterized protein n=1 Tax=Muraenolepis orangiensis TaxID=630683 RepID=A0A9Q0EDT9_9TELE|nr:hypothetical protein NHX12_027555 [Muraenolepis orangiensis]
MDTGEVGGGTEQSRDLIGLSSEPLSIEGVYSSALSPSCGAVALFIAISSPHRCEAQEAVSHCINALKANAPIWKKVTLLKRFTSLKIQSGKKILNVAGPETAEVSEMFSKRLFGEHLRVSPNGCLENISECLGEFHHSENISVCLGVFHRSENISECLGAFHRSESISVCGSVLPRSGGVVIFFYILDISAYNAFVIWMAFEPRLEQRETAISGGAGQGID